MTKVSRKNSRGFTFVELLAVVLVLAVLAAVAIPIYMNSRRSAAARTCKSNIGTIARAESAFATRNGNYTTMAGLQAGVPEGIEADVRCPLTGTNTYQIVEDGTTTAIAAGETGAITIRCSNDTAHNTATGAAVLEWNRDLPAIPVEPAGL